ncbi:AAA family ATPase [Microbacterium sp. C7(2022)]|uniref:AAA family ATPase n=1 Tax=Microbacterium sp. C7(2022) TaxID=2992759 RepID=UPI00237A4B61|nr:AAA family ATPase [Microbacterium sp. C7(2022)]MDE0545407.1 AAA family ATPase [Microbacterium sp. C7(2022)]
MLIVMAGLPGVGKSAVAGELAHNLKCAVLSVDPIEAAMWRAGVARSEPTGLAAYVVAEDLAREQLRHGNAVIVDAVNDADAARAQWTALASELDETLAFIEVYCSDEATHRDRLETRRRNIPGFVEPTWESVTARRAAFDEWEAPRLRLDSMRPLAALTREAVEYVTQARSRNQ